jgi:AcrR family transcriptional regulator
MATSEAGPPLRADARRNRDAILIAARQVFADEGLGAPLDRIAKLADVGRATLYRRFPTREVLIGAIFQDNIAALQAVAEASADAPEAFFNILDAAIAQQRDNLGFVELFTRPLRPEAPNAESVGLGDMRFAWADVIREPLARAQAAGLVRADLEAEDTGALLLMTGAMTSAIRGRADGELRRTRILALLRDGLDPAGGPRHLD